MSSNKFHFTKFLYINFSHTYLNHFLPILVLPTTTTAASPFSATRWTTQSSWDVIALAYLR